MDSKTKQGSIGEAKVICKLLEEGYSVFTQFSGKASFDMIAEKDGELKRIEVKSTRTKSKSKNYWSVQLKKVRPNRSQNKIVRFDKNQCDILAVYIEPEDKVVLINSDTINQTCQLSVEG